MTPLPPRSQMLRAFLQSDPAAEGIFFVAVRTTGIFCRPTCPARKPLPENVEFFPNPQEALLGGYRACKRCRPMDGAKKPPPLVDRLRDAVERHPTGRLLDKDLIALGIEPTTARRQFRSYLGMTFHAYQRSRRMGLALRDVREGRDLLTVGLDQGYESTSGFRDAFARAFGRPPGNARGSDCLLARWIETPLGTMLALADNDGLRLLDFLDRRGLERKMLAIRKSLGTAIVPGDNPHLDAITTALAAYFTGARLTFDIPLIPVGSDWQIKVWTHLHTIPPGSTKSYSAMANDLDRPTASRAVGNANGLNFLSIVIPCHRVIRADGSLCGYGGGLWRKQWLLDHERTHALPNGDNPVG